MSEVSLPAARFQRVAGMVARHLAELLRASVVVLDQQGNLVAVNHGTTGSSLDDPGPSSGNSWLRVPVRCASLAGEIVIGTPRARGMSSPRLVRSLVELLIDHLALIDELPVQRELKSKFIHDLLNGMIIDDEEVDVPIPTYRRKAGLAIVLTSLLGQTFTDFDVIISSQTGPNQDYLDNVEIQTLVQALSLRGQRVTLLRHLPRRGLAEHRQFLLEQSHAPYVHFLDDDVLLEPMVMERILGVIRYEGCGFVGCPAIGLQFLHDLRPHELRHFEPWEEPVRPEPFTPDSIPWERHKVNNAANPLHLEQQYCRAGQIVRYQVA